MFNKDAENSLPALSPENFERLPPEAQAAFCFRAAARLLPLLGSGKEGFGFWPEAERETHLVALFTALDASLLHGLENSEPLYPVSDDALVIALHAAHVAYRDGAADYRVIDVLTDVIKDDATTTAQQALEAWADTLSPMSFDLAWWLEQREGGWSQRLSRAFVERPLWQTDLGDEPPGDWLEHYARWQKSVMSLDRPDLVEQYEGWLQGRIESSEAISRRIAAWYGAFTSPLGVEAEGGDLSSAMGKASGVDAKGFEFADLADDAFQTSPAQSAFLAGEAAAAPESMEPARESPGAPFDSGELGAGVVTAQADKPAGVDHLGREPLVNTLADMLASPDQSLPMTIALLGDWGAGKSSVIEQLKRRLVELAEVRKLVAERENVCSYLFAEFNAWEYEQTDNIRAGLAQEVVNGLIRDQNWIQKTSFAFANAWRQHRWEFGWSLFGFASVILATVAALFSGKSDLTTGAAAPFIGVGGAMLFSFVLYRAWTTARTVLENPLASQLRTYLKLPSYGKHLGLVPVIRQQIAALCRHRLGSIQNGRLLVVVDDLDRCSPECITETLDAVRLVMSLDNVAVIIAIDDRVAFQAVVRHYEKLGDAQRPGSAIARDYLGKIIQLPINLPPPGERYLKDFIHKSLFDVKAPRPSTAPGLKRGGSAAEREAARPQGDARPDHPVAGNSSMSDEEKRVPATPASAAQPDRTAQVKASFERARRKMEDTSEERDWFETLAQVLALSNPRQLIRLKNSYRFLKGANHSGDGGGGDGRLASRAMMCALFWSEYLYQMPLVDPADASRGRHHAEVRMWNMLGGDETADESSAEARMARQFAEVLSGLNRPPMDYFNLMRQVAMVVMPSAQGGVFLSQAELERWVGGKSDT